MKKIHLLAHGLERDGVQSQRHVPNEVLLRGRGRIGAVSSLGSTPNLLDEVQLAMKFRQEEDAKSTRGADIFEYRTLPQKIRLIVQEATAAAAGKPAGACAGTDILVPDRGALRVRTGKVPEAVPLLVPGPAVFPGTRAL